MRIINEKPPIYEDALKAFNFNPDTTVFTYGDNLYNPAGLTIHTDLLIHEMVHMEQQKHDDTVAKIWWQRYIQDTAFRLDQELEAYGEQYRYICGQVKDKNKRYRILRILAGFLSGPMYGNIISMRDAELQITRFANYKLK